MRTGGRCSARLRLTLTGVVLTGVVLTAGFAARTDPPPVSVYAKLPTIRSISVSPHGEHLLVLRAIGETYQAVAISTATGKSNVVMAADPDEFLFNWCGFANPTRVLCSIRFYDTLRASQVDARSVRRYRDGRTTFTRLLAADIDGSNTLQLVPPGNVRGGDIAWNPPDQDNIISWLPDDPEHVLIQLRRDDRVRPSVYRLNVYRNRLRRERRHDEQVRVWYADRLGTLRFATGFRDLEPVAFRVEQDQLRPVSLDALGGVAPPVPAGFGPDGRGYAFSYLNGERRQLVSIDPARPESPETLFADPDYDVFGRLFLHPTTGRPMALQYQRETLTTHWFDDDTRTRFAPVEATLRKVHSRISLLDASRDLNVLAFRAEGKGTTPTYYLYQEDRQALQRLARNYEELPAVAEARAIRYPARDGYEVPAYLTTPAGPGPFPTILYPHGGPNLRDTDAFDYWTQFFVSRGYAVLQPNFRGSIGYGAEHLRAGFRQWGLKMQDDVMDGLDYLIAEKIADPERVCVVGGSYGGYVALVAAFKTPERLRCAVSFAGVTDLADLKTRWRSFDLGELPIARVQDGAAVQANSPLAQVKRIDLPLLIAHGDVDRSVMIEQSRRLVAELEAAGKPYRYLEQPGGDHFLSLERHRLEFFEALDGFLSAHLAP